MELTIFSQAYQAIMQANTIDEIKEIRDKAEALRMYLKQQGDGLEMQNACAEIKLRAERKAGELLKEMKETGERASLGEYHGNQYKNGLSNDATTLSNIGLTRSQSSRFQSVASIPLEVFESHIIETKVKDKELTTASTLKLAKELKRKEQRQQQIEAIKSFKSPIEEELFHVIAIDPPWPYEKRPDDITHRAANPYPSMTIEQMIDGIHIPATDDSILWLWTTNAFMKEAYYLADSWNFQVKTILTWEKDNMGLGDWLRGKTEHCLMCIRGKPIVNLTNQTTIIHGPLREHSRKPDEFYHLVESLCYGNKLEMFAREQREGWTSYGIENDKF